MRTHAETLRHQGRIGGRRVLGLSLIALGLVLFAQRVGYLSQHPQHYWTLIPAAVGLCHLFEPGRRALGLVLLTWGLLLCAHQFDLLSLKQSWPLMVVAGGAGILLQGFDRSIRRQHEEE